MWCAAGVCVRRGHDGGGVEGFSQERVGHARRESAVEKQQQRRAGAAAGGGGIKTPLRTVCGGRVGGGRAGRVAVVGNLLVERNFTRTIYKKMPKYARLQLQLRKKPVLSLSLSLILCER